MCCCTMPALDGDDPQRRVALLLDELAQRRSVGEAAVEAVERLEQRRPAAPARACARGVDQRIGGGGQHLADQPLARSEPAVDGRAPEAELARRSPARRCARRAGSGAWPPPRTSSRLAAAGRPRRDEVVGGPLMARPTLAAAYDGTAQRAALPPGTRQRSMRLGDLPRRIRRRMYLPIVPGFVTEICTTAPGRSRRRANRRTCSVRAMPRAAAAPRARAGQPPPRQRSAPASRRAPHDDLPDPRARAARTVADHPHDRERA